jgi:pimeloyl-ACP methyl ester carboxylesterase
VTRAEAGATGVASAAPTSSAAPAAKPTIVIEHGAWADASSFARVVQGLQAQGYTVDVPANSLAGLASDTATLADYLKTISGPIVLVGHSYGGMVITDAATGNPQVKALVYIDAYVPAAGESALQLTSAKPGSCLLTAPSSAPAWKTIPSWDLVGTRDNVIPPAEQLFMAHRAGAHIVKISASHLSMISHPGAVKSLIDQAANTVS